MKTSILLLTILGAAFAAPKDGYDNLELAKSCKKAECHLPDCLCASTKPPGGLNPKDIPQLVFLTFDDAVRIENINYYREAFRGRKNPDGCPIGTTYFVSHEYTNYSLVHELWSEGHEIALHSITHQTPAEYWKNLTVEGNMNEYADLRKLISFFAEIPEKDIQGIRAPFLQLCGNNSFEMIKKAGLKYDCSWPTRNYVRPGLWPYTLDYKSPQDCQIGPCPTASLPGVWIAPMVNWEDDQGYPCSMVDSCIFVSNEEDKILEFMKRNFYKHYDITEGPEGEAAGNKAPFGFYVHAAWFDKNPANYRAYLRFLDFLQDHPDVYLVSIQRGLQWVQNPHPLSELKQSWPSCQALHSNTCRKGKDCHDLPHFNEVRRMNVCSEFCPAVYPWLGNPYGEEKPL